MHSLLVSIAAICLAASSASLAQTAAKRGGRINNLKVLSNHVDDVTTVENILKSFVKPGMSDAERSKALWTAAVRYRHQTAPPNEFLADDWEAHDPVKIFNVYGYCMCCCCSAILEALNRADGREARGRILNGHSVPEVRYADSWHMFDCSLINYFPKEGGDVAAVDEITKAIQDWYTENPSYHNNGDKLAEMMRSDGWNGYKKGPKLLAETPYYNLGWWPARTHGWNATMTEYDRKSEVYDYGYQLGHRALFSLRPGESLVREAGNHGLHVNGDKDPGWDALKAKAPEADLGYLKGFLPGYNGGVVGNGYHRYAPDLASGGLAGGAEVYDNLASGGTPPLHPAAGGKPGSAVIEMSSPYVYLGGRIKVSAFRESKADSVALLVSTNNGRTFDPVWKAETVGTSEAAIDLGKRVLRRYAYWVKIELHSATPRGAGLNALSIESDIQHAPRTIPWLAKGGNQITVSADGDTKMATRTVSCRITPDTAFTKNETTGSMGVAFDNLDVREGSCWWKGGIGSMTVPVQTPGAIKSFRFGGQVRARGDKDAVSALVSFDEGKTWREAGKISGPTAGTTRYFQCVDVPAGSKKALLRYALSGNNTVGIFSFRADVDYEDPLAGSSMKPFFVIHRWKENGKEMSKRALISTLPATYSIDAAADPEMVSVSYEMPAR